MRSISDNDFINILKQSETFILQEAFSKVKNAKLIAAFPDTKSLIMENDSKEFYYAGYSIQDDNVSFTDLEKLEIADTDNVKALTESINLLFEGNYEKKVKELGKTISNFITESNTPYSRVKNKIELLLKEDRGVVSTTNKHLKVKNLTLAKKFIKSLNDNDFFKKFIVEFEEKNKVPMIYEKFDFKKPACKIFRNKKVIESSVITESTSAKKYSKVGFKKSSLLARKLWKNSDFRKRLTESIKEPKKMDTFLARYKNITLLESSELEEMLSKTLMAVSGVAGLAENLQIIKESLQRNKSKMLSWKLLTEAPEDMDAARQDGAVAGDVPPQALDASGEQAPAEEAPAEGPVDETEQAGAIDDQDAGMPTDEELEPQAEKENAIVNSLLSVIEKIFWNGNQENNELANLIKELRDMREAGVFDEDRLAEIFTDLFDITQQVASNSEQESPAGEEGETIPVEGEETEEVAPAEGEGLPDEAPAEETPLDNY